MNILYINTYYNGGGAEKVMRQLYHGVHADDTNTYCMVGRLQEHVEADVRMIYTSFLGRAITTASGALLRNTLLYTPHAVREIIRCIDENDIDIVHFHNIHSNYLGLRDLQTIRQHCPHIVITLHDMWTLTGGCAYAFECDRWSTAACKSCDGNESMTGFRMSSFVLQEKVRALAGRGIQYVVPSQWLEQCCQESYLRNEAVSLIYNGISMEHFREHDQVEARRKHGLPSNKHLLLFAANGVDNVYKGFRYLREALLQIPNKQDYALVVVGNQGKAPLDLPFDIHAVGYIRDEVTLSELYSAADLFILPSVADNLPFTPIESMASGTPVLAFETGGIPEIVTDEVGWTVPMRDVQSLVDQIEQIFREDRREEYLRKRSACRGRAEQLFDEQMMFRQYEELYRRMLRTQ